MTFAVGSSAPAAPGEPAAPAATADHDALLAVCGAVADELLADGFELPSVYVLTGGRLRCYAAHGYHQVVDGFPPGVGVVGETVARGAATVVPDVADHPQFIAAVPGIRAEACVPVRLDGAVIGAVNVESRSALPPDAVARLEQAAERLAARIGRLGGLPPPTLAQRLAQATLRLAALTEADDIEQATAAAAAELSGMSSAAVVGVPPRRPRVRTASGPLREALCAWSPDDIEVVRGWVRAGTSSHLPGGHDDREDGYRFLRDAGVRGMSVHPLVHGGTVHALLVVADREPVAHATDVVECLETLAAHAASQLAVASLVAELARRAEQDGLTGLRNTASFARDLETQRAPRTLLLLDVDHFKLVNDTLGHVSGDELLKRLATAMAGAVRADERLYRIGGDEFAVLAYGDGEAAAAALATRLLQSAAAAGVSVSIGTARVRPGEGEAARHAADAALYRAKADGRGRCVHARS